MFFLLLGLLLSPNKDIEIQFYETVVNMPLGSNPYDYVHIPYAKVIVEGIEVNDAHIIYERGVERTFLSVLHTKEVKSFDIKYRAHAPDYKISKTVTITFKVYDDIPPTIIQKYDLVFEVGQKVKFIDAFDFKDNYDAIQTLQIYIFESKVNLNRVGTYELVVSVKDQSLNETTQIFLVEIKDYEPPVITLKKEMHIEIFTQLDVNQFILVKDNHDQQPSLKVNTSAVDFKTLGTYNIEICATDQSLNSTCLTTTITLIDTTKPELILISYVPTIEVHTPLYLVNLYDYIVDVSDNYDDLKILDVQIQSDVDIDQIGQYVVVYLITDQSHNTTSKTLKVMVKDTQPPTVTPVKDLNFDVFENILPWSLYFKIQDNHDDLIRLEIKYQSNINIEKLGTYKVEVFVKDSSRNEATYTFYVEVLDRIPPKIEVQDAMIITDFKQPNYLERLKIKDQYDELKDLDIMIDDTHMDYTQIGIYEILVTVKDKSGNTSQILLDVFIVDIIPPEIILKTTAITIDIQINSLNFRSYIQSVEDNITALKIEDVRIEHNIEFGVIGKYQVHYIVSDASFSTSMVVLEVKIDVLTSLNIQSKNLSYMMGDSIDLYDALEISNIEIHDIKMYYNTQLYQVPGIYEVMFVVYDVSGQHQVIKRLVTIKEPIADQVFRQYFPMSATLILGLTFSFILKRYLSRDRFDKHQQFIYNEDSNN